MFKGFIAWLDSHISREEPSSIIKSLIGLMTFAGFLGTVFGNHAVRAGAFVVVVILILSVTLTLLADRRRLRQENDSQRALIVRYSTYLVESHPAPQLSIDCWRQWVFVQPNGDVREVLKVKAVVLGEPMHFLRLTAACLWDQPEKYRHGVKITASRLLENGAPGPQWDVTTSWLSLQKMIYIAHLHQAVHHGEELSFKLVRQWPAKCLPLMREKEADDFVLRATSRLQIQNVEYRIVLPSGFDAVHELVGSTEPGVHLSTATEHDEEDRKVFVWRSTQIPTMTRIGMRLQLK
jgi:hypothetical protein